jgi:hypothetical protein
LTPQDLAAMRGHKAELLVALQQSAPIQNSNEAPAPSPFSRFIAAWRVTAKRIHDCFTRNEITPSQETMQAATWLAFQLHEPWSPFRRISKVAAQHFVEAILQGRCTARIDDYARVVVRNAPRSAGENHPLIRQPTNGETSQPTPGALSIPHSSPAGAD